MLRVGLCRFAGLAAVVTSQRAAPAAAVATVWHDATGLASSSGTKIKCPDGIPAEVTCWAPGPPPALPGVPWGIDFTESWAASQTRDNAFEFIGLE